MWFLFLCLAAVAFLLICGGYVFFSACRRRAELPWMDRQQLQKTPYGKYYDCIVDADRYLTEQNARDVYITSQDGLKLHGLWLEAENARGTMLLVHGYRSTKLVDFGVAFAYYRERGFHILVPDQRCHGLSQGKYITFGVKESGDILKWIQWHNENIGNIPMFLSGLSMGASTVMYLADQALPSNVRGLIADCGFTSPAEIISKVYRDVVHMPPGPVMYFANMYARVLAGFGLYEKNTVRSLKNKKLPILMIHGTKDDFVPCDMTRRGYEAANEPKTLLLVEGAGHGVSFLVDNEGYARAVDRFIADNL